MDYNCNICNKNYANYQSLYKHNKRCHNGDNKTECEYCYKKYSRAEYLPTHYKICKKRKEHLSRGGDMDNELNEILESVINVGENSTKISKDDLIKQIKNCWNKQLNNGIMNNGEMNDSLNDNSTINNNNSTTNVTNVINIGKIEMLGNEDLINTLSQKEQKKILNQRYNSLKYIVEHVHFNEDYPQFQNISISDLKSPYGEKYDEKYEDFISLKKSDLLDEVIENRLSDIDEFLATNKEYIAKNTKNKIIKFVKKMSESFDEDSKAIKETRKELEVICYNNRHIVNKRKKEIKQMKKNKQTKKFGKLIPKQKIINQ